MGPSGFEPESSGPEPPRIDQATPRTHATRGKNGVGISVVAKWFPADTPLRGNPGTRMALSESFRWKELGSTGSITTESIVSSMDQLQMEPQARKKKKQAKLEFDAAKVFGTSKDEEFEMDLDSARYKAQKGQGGDRRG